MSLAERLADTSRLPVATVRLNGARWADWLVLSRAQSYGGGISGGAVEGRNPPMRPAVGMPISWSWGYARPDGTGRSEIDGFTGVVSEVVEGAYPQRISVKVADPLWKADRQQKDIATDPLNSIAASAAVKQILAGAGLTRLSIPTLPASGSAWSGGEWVLGTLTPVSFPNSTALAAANKICETLGFWLYCDAGGVARAVQLERRPSDSPFRTLRWGVDFLITGTPRRTRPDTAKNRIVVRGATTGVQGAQIWDEWMTGAGDRSHELTFDLVEFVNEAQAGEASATGVAKRTLRLWSREPSITDIPRLKADPRLSVGMTVAVECSLIGFPSPKPFFVYSLSTTLDRRKGDFSQQLTLDGGTGDQGYTTIPPPEASFTWRIVRETLDGVGVVELFLDGTSSRSLADGEIVSYAWSTATATALGMPTTATGPKAMFVYPAATAIADVTLTVTDTSSKTGSYSQAIPLAGDDLVQPTSRVISLALGSAWAVTPDGGETWRVETTGDSTLVPEVSGDALLSTRATGSTGLRGTSDALATASEALAGLGGQITALSVTPVTGVVWAAVGVSLYRSIDGGATFTLWGTLPATITAVLEDPAVPSSVFVLAGADMWHSTLDTPGTAWATLYAGPEGATARHLVRGESGATTWIAYTGTFIGSPLQRVEGPLTAVWPLGTSPDVTEVRAVALAPDEATVYAWDSEGRGWSVDSETGLATAIAATLASGETAQHALHDPDDAIVYLATFGETAGTTYKYFPLIGGALFPFYVPASGQQSHRVGLGVPLTVAARIIVPPWGESGAGDVIQVWESGAWTTRPAPSPGNYWQSIAINPFASLEWLLWGNSTGDNSSFIRTGTNLRMADGTTPPLWRTTDGGLTWSAVELPSPDVAQTTMILNTAPVGVQFTGIGTSWALSGWVGSPNRSVVWRGDEATAAAPTIVGDASANQIGAGTVIVGMAGDMALVPIEGVAGSGDYSSSRMAVLTIDGSVSVPTGASGVGRDGVGGTAIIMPGTRQLILSRDGGLYGAADYRAGQVVDLGISVAGMWLAPLADGSLFAAGAAGVERVTNPFGAAMVAASSIAGGGVVVSDTATRTVAVASDGAGYSIWDGESWVVNVLAPAGVALSGFFAVVRVDGGGGA
jgi:hypothetical protein